MRRQKPCVTEVQMPLAIQDKLWAASFAFATAKTDQNPQIQR
jgi:hypothetical protein